MSLRSSTISSSTDDSLEYSRTTYYVDTLLSFLQVISFLATVITYILYNFDVVTYKTFVGTSISAIILFIITLIRTIIGDSDVLSIRATIIFLIILGGTIYLLGYQLQELFPH